MDEGQVVQQGLRSKLDRESGIWQCFVDELGKENEEWQEYGQIPESDINSWGEREGHVPDLGSGGGNRRPLIGSRKSFSDTSTGRDYIFEISGLSALPSRRSTALTRPFSALEPLIPVTPSIPVETFLHSPKGEDKTAASLVGILFTIWPSLGARLRVWLMVGCLAAFLHAVATPVFSFVLARLLGSILDARIHPSEAMKWSVIILGLAVVDGVNCYFLFFLFESCAQAWVETLRCESFRRIMTQPREWFDQPENSVLQLTEALEKHGEEMKNLLARFVAYTLVGVSLTAMGVIWSFYCSWKLTIVGISIAPVMYGISIGMNWSSDLWESKCKDNATNVGIVLHEVVTNIHTVKNLSLEGYFKKKYYRSTNKGLRVGKKRSIWAGIGFGLADSSILFATGE
jgi:ATP-binding cassette subfamily B (MDR/TAP) protein 1